MFSQSDYFKENNDWMNMLLRVKEKQISHVLGISYVFSI